MALVSLAVAACDPAQIPGASAPTGGTAQVALLVPQSAPDGNVRLLAQNLANAAQLGAADVQGVNIELQVFDTGGTPAGAAQAASLAASQGADVILGPLYAQSALAAGVAVQGSGINVLTFSNDPAVAGGNVFLLGPLFENTARRVVSFAQRRGMDSFMVVSAQSEAEAVGRDAIIRAVQAAGGSVVGSETFQLSEQGIVSAAPRIAASAQSAGADVLFLTSGPEGALPLLVQLLPEAGMTSDRIQYAGLARWDIPNSAPSLPGLQGGWFALPDPQLTSQFAARYQNAYGVPPHPVASLGYDGMAAIGAAATRSRDLSAAALTRGNGFAGASGVFRFFPNGTNERGLAIATIENRTVTVIDPAPRRLGGAGF